MFNIDDQEVIKRMAITIAKLETKIARMEREHEIEIEALNNHIMQIEYERDANHRTMWSLFLTPLKVTLDEIENDQEENS